MAEDLPLALTADSSGVYIGKAGGKLETFSRFGRFLWSADLGGSISSDLILTESSILLSTSPAAANGKERSESVLRSLSKETGITQWTAVLPPAEKHYLHLSNGSIIVVSDDGSIRSLDHSGKILWKREITAGFYGRPAFSATSLVIAGSLNQIFKVSMQTGEIEALIKYQYPVSAVMVRSDGNAVAGDERGNIVAFRGSSEKPYWRFKSGGQISGLIEIGDKILAVSHDNFVYLVESNDGDVVWKRRLSGRIAHSARVFDRYVMLAALDDNGAVFIELEGGKVVEQLTLADGEKMLTPPISNNGWMFAATTSAAYGYSASGCDTNSEGGTITK